MKTRSGEIGAGSRIVDAQSNVLITGDGGWMNNKIVELKKITDEAVDRAHDIVHRVIVLKRTGHDIHMQAGRDVWWHELAAQPGMVAWKDRIMAANPWTIPSRPPMSRSSESRSP